MDASAYRAQHLSDYLDPQGEQMILEDLIDLQTPEYSDRHPCLFRGNEIHKSRSALPNLKPMQPSEIEQSI